MKVGSGCIMRSFEKKISIQQVGDYINHQFFFQADLSSLSQPTIPILFLTHY